MFAQGQTEDSLTFMRAAADLEDASKKHISMENRLIPMRELLADMLLQAGKPTEALVEYETSLKQAPNRFRSYYGAAKAAQAAGDARTSQAYFQKLVSLAAGGEGARVEVVEAKQALG
jgi:Tfp pilus assembly protein PilF